MDQFETSITAVGSKETHGDAWCGRAGMVSKTRSASACTVKNTRFRSRTARLAAVTVLQHEFPAYQVQFGRCGCCSTQ